jgi:toxin ParE1/3/4
LRRIQWSPPALEDLRRIVAHYLNIDPELAVRIAEAIRQAPDRLLDRPRLGAPLGYGELRKWSVGRLPYVILYRVEGDTIGIVRVYHHAQNWRRP